jgi:hypothetical protein
MTRTLIISAAVVAATLGLASVSEAQVFVRAPFVRVAVGDGVAVRAPFVNLYVPPAGPTYYSPFGPRIIYTSPPPVVVMPPAQSFTPPAPQPLPLPQPPANPPIVDNGPPQPVQPAQVPTLESFAKTFQPKAGSYEVTIINPATKQPTNVRFNLPEGEPRRVIVNRYSIEFVYTLRQWTRIEFDRDGVVVTTR